MKKSVSPAVVIAVIIVVAVVAVFLFTRAARTAKFESPGGRGADQMQRRGRGGGAGGGGGRTGGRRGGGRADRGQAGAGWQLACQAWKNQYYVASATTTRDSRIYDITGEVLSRSGFWGPWTEACLNLGKRLFETDFHMEKMHALQAKYEDRVSVEWIHDEDWFTLASNDPQVSVQELIQEFDLLPVTEYHQRCELAQDKARAGG